MQQALRRDVLQWLVSLNLSFPIKNIKRDFSNGFLVAEILSRYYPHDVQMHSFDYGTKLAKKKDNWDQLRKIFWKEDFPFFEDEIESIINCGPHDGVASLLERLYGFLTHKRYKPEDVDVDELWHGIPDTNVLFKNDVTRLSTEDCKYLSSSLDQDAFRTIESRYASSGKALRDLGNEQNVMMEMDISRGEVAPSFKGTLSPLTSIEFGEQCSNSIREDQYLAMLEPKDDFGIDDEDDEEEDQVEFDKENTMLVGKENTTVTKKRNVLGGKENVGSMRKSQVNAVERARMKDKKSKPIDISTKGKNSEKQDTLDNAKARDVTLAFRSPNRQRQFKTYTLQDYRKQQPGVYIELGKLGPETTESLLNQREKLEKMKAFGRVARDINVVQDKTQEVKKAKQKRQSCREKAIEFASKLPKPKKKVVQKENSKDQARNSPRPLTEIEKMEAKHQKDRQKIELIRRDLESFLR